MNSAFTPIISYTDYFCSGLLRKLLFRPYKTNSQYRFYHIRYRVLSNHLSEVQHWNLFVKSLWSYDLFTYIRILLLEHDENRKLSTTVIWSFISNYKVIYEIISTENWGTVGRPDEDWSLHTIDASLSHLNNIILQ